MTRGKIYPLDDNPILDLSIDPTQTKVIVNKALLDSNYKGIVIPFHGSDGIPIYFDFPARSVDINLVGNGGVIDGLGKVNSVQYHLFAYCQKDGSQMGYGLAQVPTSSFTITGSLSKGASATLNDVTKPNRFPKGARVRVSGSVCPTYAWNLGTVTAQGSTSLTVQLDNNTNWGTAISTGLTPYKVELLDNFRLPPLLTYPYYRILGIVETNGSGVLSRLYSWPIKSYRVVSPYWIFDASRTYGDMIKSETFADLLGYIPEKATQVHLVFWCNGFAADGAYFGYNSYIQAEDTIYNKGLGGKLPLTIPLQTNGIFTMYYNDKGSANIAMLLCGWEM